MCPLSIALWNEKSRTLNLWIDARTMRDRVCLTKWSLLGIEMNRISLELFGELVQCSLALEKNLFNRHWHVPDLLVTFSHNSHNRAHNRCIVFGVKNAFYRLTFLFWCKWKISWDLKSNNPTSYLFHSVDSEPRIEPNPLFNATKRIHVANQLIVKLRWVQSWIWINRATLDGQRSLTTHTHTQHQVQSDSHQKRNPYPIQLRILFQSAHAQQQIIISVSSWLII